MLSLFLSCHYSDDLGILLKQSKQLKGRTIHTTATLADKLQEIVGVPMMSERNEASDSRSVVGGLLESMLNRCRAFKTEAEVACILRANEASGKAHQAMWQACHPGAGRD
jgi:Xaa-Pro aminopeptidase